MPRPRSPGTPDVAVGIDFADAAVVAGVDSVVLFHGAHRTPSRGVFGGDGKEDSWPKTLYAGPPGSLGSSGFCSGPIRSTEPSTGPFSGLQAAIRSQRVDSIHGRRLDWPILVSGSFFSRLSVEGKHLATRPGLLNPRVTLLFWANLVHGSFNWPFLVSRSFFSRLSVEGKH